MACAHRPTLGQILAQIPAAAGLYAAGSVLCFAHLAGALRGAPAGRVGPALASAFCAACGVYLLDRVKLRDALLDPADALAHPARAGTIARAAGPLRLSCLLLLLAASALAAPLAWWLIPLPFCGALAVLFYAGRPRGERARPKDLPLAKNVLVALGMTALAALMTAAWPRARLHAGLWAFAGAQLFARVWADAALSDLDDEVADRAFGTGTLATKLGKKRAWDIALAIRLGLAATLLILPIGPAAARYAWAGITAVSSITLRAARPRAVRPWVDARLPLEALAALGLAALLGPAYLERASRHADAGLAVAAPETPQGRCGAHSAGGPAEGPVAGPTPAAVVVLTGVVHLRIP